MRRAICSAFFALAFAASHAGEIPPGTGADRVGAVPMEAPPRPEKAETGRYLVGAWMCPLWKPGAINGREWQAIMPFPERKPLLGWYNEADPAVTDWEIKWALEHGISFLVPCWFREHGNLGQPVKPWLGHWLHDGLFKSQYGNLIKFALLWENSHEKACGVASEKDLLENILPFWLENYFHRKNYLTIDGKPVLFVYRPEVLVKELGGEEATRVAIEKMRAACVREGFKGLLVIGEHHGSPADSLRQMKAIGMDLTSSYHWPSFTGKISLPITAGGIINTQEECWNQQEKNASLPAILTVSMGWDSRPWDPKFPVSSCWQLKPDDFQALCERARAKLDARPGDALEGRMILVDNWNEFGEGHHILPTQQFGFGHLDAIRRVFAADAPPHSDSVPKSQ